MLMTKNEKRREIVETVTSIHYERINFRVDFKNKGYVKKVLSLYEREGSGRTPNHFPDIDVVYYNNREQTNVPCLDKEILIISNYNEGINTYTLVQTDFSIPTKYKILLIKNNRECSCPKGDLFNYIRDCKLVEIKKERPLAKQPQIDDGYGSILVEILESLNPKEVFYHENKLNELIMENASLSNMFLEFEREFKHRETASIRLNNRVRTHVNLIYSHSDKEELTIKEVLQLAKKYQENYYYNI